MKIGSASPSFGAQTLNKTKELQEKLYEQLSSGLKINKAKDDAAGLQLANRLTSEINGTTQAIRNANDAISYSQVADAALSGVTDATFRIEELSIQAANGTLSANDRKAIQAEITQLQAQVGDIYSNTRFGDKAVFGEAVDFQVGAGSNQTIQLQTGSASLADIDVTTQDGAQNAIDTARSFREQVDSSRASIGAFQNRVESTISNLNNVNINSQSSRSQIVDADYAKSVSEKTSQDILGQANIALQAQANISNRQILNLLG
jgi:flagellin